MTPQAQREAVAYLRTTHNVSERRACSVLGIVRALVRYRSRGLPTRPCARGSGNWPPSEGGSIDIYMDGFSLHWRSAPLRRTVNYRVGLVIRVPGRIGSAHRPVNRRTNDAESHASDGLVSQTLPLH